MIRFEIIKSYKKGGNKLLKDDKLWEIWGSQIGNKSNKK